MTEVMVREGTQQDFDAILGLWREMAELHQEIEPMVWTLGSEPDGLFRQHLAGRGIYIADFFNAIAEEFKTDREGFVRRIQFDHVAANSKCSSGKVDIVSGVLNIG